MRIGVISENLPSKQNVCSSDQLALALAPVDVLRLVANVVHPQQLLPSHCGVIESVLLCVAFTPRGCGHCQFNAPDG